MTGAEPLTARVKALLAERLRAVAGVTLDRRGYILDRDSGRVPESTAGIRAAARRQFVHPFAAAGADVALDQIGQGAGSELAWRRGHPPKFLAAHSSAALAANTFAPSLKSPAALWLAGSCEFTRVKLEAKLRITGVHGGAPNLDALAERSAAVVAVEGKLTEHLARKTGVEKGDFSAIEKRKAIDGEPEPYGEALAALGADRSWSGEYAALRADPLRFRHLGATQLVKHYLGLKSLPGARAATLLYVYWQPTNWWEFAETRAHRAEIERFAAAVRDATVRFHALSYQELWATWLAESDGIGEHVAALRERYEFGV